MTDHRHDELRGAYLGGESLTPAERLELRRLLASDPEAAQELDELRSLASTLRADPALLEDLRDPLKAPNTPEAPSPDRTVTHIAPLRAPSQIVRQCTTALAGVAAGLAIVATVVIPGRFEPTPALPSHPGATSTTPATKEPEDMITQQLLGDSDSGLAVGVEYWPEEADTLMIVKVGGNIPKGTEYQVGIYSSIPGSEPPEFEPALTSEIPESANFWTSKASGWRTVDLKKLQKAPVAGLFRINPSKPPSKVVVRTLNPLSTLFEGDLNRTPRRVLADPNDKKQWSPTTGLPPGSLLGALPPESTSPKR